MPACASPGCGGSTRFSLASLKSVRTREADQGAKPIAIGTSRLGRDHGISMTWAEEGSKLAAETDASAVFSLVEAIRENEIKIAQLESGKAAPAPASLAAAVSPSRAQESASASPRLRLVPQADNDATAAAAAASDEVDLYVGARIRLRREALGTAPEKLAEAIGVSAARLRNYETGAERISASRIYAIATALDIAVCWFFDGVDPATTPAGAAGAASAAECRSLQRESLQLMRAYFRISDPEAKRRLYQLARQLADDSGSDSGEA